MDTSNILGFLQQLLGTKQQTQGTQFGQALGLQSQQVQNQSDQAKAALAAQVQAQQAAEQLAQQQQQLAVTAQNQGNTLATNQLAGQQQEANRAGTPSFLSFLSQYKPAFDSWGKKTNAGNNYNFYPAAVNMGTQPSTF